MSSFCLHAPRPYARDKWEQFTCGSRQNVTTLNVVKTVSKKMFEKINFSPKNRVLGIAGLHGVAALYGLFYAILNIIKEERPITDGDVFYILLHMLLHVFLISSLVVGATTSNFLYLIPWLIFSLPIFISISYYTLKYSRVSYTSQVVVNIFFISLAWYCWFTVFYCCKKLYNGKRKLDLT